MAAETKAARAERRRLAAQQRERGQPEITKQGTCHIAGTCASCYFWDSADPEAGAGRGICRERSPQLVGMQSMNGTVVQAMWPIRVFSEKCGRHTTPDLFAARLRAERILLGLDAAPGSANGSPN